VRDEWRVMSNEGIGIVDSGKRIEDRRKRKVDRG